MNGGRLGHIMTMMRQLGVGYILTLVALGLFQLWFLGQHPDARSRFGPYIWNCQFLIWTPVVLISWMAIWQYHARLALSATRIRVPGVLRMVCISLAGSGACTLIALIGTTYLLDGPVILELSTVLFAIYSGLLITLFGGTRWQLPLYGACFGLVMAFISFEPTSLFMSKLLGPLVLATVLVTAWRLRALVNALRAGPANKTLQYLVAGKWNMLAGWVASSDGYSNSSLRTALTGGWSAACRAAEGSNRRSGKPSPASAFRSALSPVPASNEMSVWLVFMALPITLSFLSQETISVFLQYYFGTVAFAFAFSGVTVLVARARRSGELLWNQHGEIADLAILPGLGDTRLQRRALLHEALIRPLIHYAAWFCGLTGSWWVLAWTGRVPVQSILLLPELMCSMLMLFAMMSVGVLSSQLDRLSVWFKGLAYLSAIPAVFSLISLQLWSFGLLHAPASPSSLLIWQSIANVSIVGGMAVCLIAWGIQLSRRPNLLCR